MKRIFLSALGVLISTTLLCAHDTSSLSFAGENVSSHDSLPDVFGDNRADLVESNLRNEARLRFATHQLPPNKEEWEKERKIIREKIIQNSGLKVDHQLPLDMRETGTTQMEGYTIKNIYFQTHPGVYATANLYVPDGKGPFPAVINMLGVWSVGFFSESVLCLGHYFGFFCL